MEDLKGYNEAEVGVRVTERERGSRCREFCLDYDTGWVVDLDVLQWILLSHLAWMRLIPGTIGRRIQDRLKLRNVRTTYTRTMVQQWD